MATIGELAVNVVAKTQKFRKDMKSAETTAGKFTKGLKTLTVGLAAVGGALAAISIARFNQLRQQIDALAKSASKLGVLPDELTAIRLAAEEAGIEFPTVEKALTRLNSVIQDVAAGRGGKVYVETMEKLGLSASALARENPAKQFAAVAKAMRSVPQNDRLAASVTFFGGRGSDLVRLATANLADYAEQVKKLGLSVSPEDAASIEAMNDQLGRLAKFMQRGQMALVLSVGPALEASLDRIEKILGIQEDPNAGREFSALKPSTIEASLATTGLGGLNRRRIGEAELARSDVINPLRSVFREGLAAQFGRGQDAAAFSQLPEHFRKQIAIQQQTLEAIKNERQPVEIGR